MVIGTLRIRLESDVNGDHRTKLVLLIQVILVPWEIQIRQNQGSWEIQIIETQVDLWNRQISKTMAPVWDDKTLLYVLYHAPHYKQAGTLKK